MALVIGLTGGIGSGKSTVSDLFKEQGIDIIDADIIARDLVAKGSEGSKRIVEHFGPSILLANGELNRAALRELIFSDSKAKTWLENLLHPKIHQALKTQTEQATSAYCLLVAPLLIENKLQGLCHRILVVDVTRETQILRTCQRDKLSSKQVEAILAMQVSQKERLKHADDIVTNNNSKAQLNLQVKQLHAKYLSLSKQL